MNRLGCRCNKPHVIVLAADEHSLHHESTRVEATDGRDAQESLVVDVTYQEADGVHVGGDHYSGTRALADCQEVPEAIDADLIDQALDFLAHRGANSLLAPGNAGRRYQLLK
jgi:hypothetical protein